MNSFDESSIVPWESCLFLSLAASAAAALGTTTGFVFAAADTLPAVAPAFDTAPLLLPLLACSLGPPPMEVLEAVLCTTVAIEELLEELLLGLADGAAAAPAVFSAALGSGVLLVRAPVGGMHLS